MITNTINFEVWKSNYIIVYARKGEVNARTIVASFKGSDGNSIDLTNKSITFYALKPDKTQIYNNCTVDADNGTASIVLTSQMVSASGIVDCEYQIFEGNDLLLKVSGLKLVVENGEDFSEAVESTSEYNALISAINNAEEFSENVGELDDLTTTNKNNLVGAINEIHGRITPISKGGTDGSTAAQARANLGVMTGVMLWGNSAGTQGTITLSDSYRNYSLIQIIGFDNGITTDTVFRALSHSQANICNWYADNETGSSVTGLYYHGAVLNFSGTTVTFQRNGTYWLKIAAAENDTWSPMPGGNCGIKVTRIIGYTY